MEWLNANKKFIISFGELFVLYIIWIIFFKYNTNLFTTSNTWNSLLLQYKKNQRYRRKRNVWNLLKINRTAPHWCHLCCPVSFIANCYLQKKNFAHHSSLISGLYWTSISLITQQRYLVFQDVFKMSWRCLQCNIFLFFKTSSRHVCQTSSNNVF